MARLMQPSFAGGELASSLHARVDLVKYKTGAKLLRNFVIHPHGGVSNRPGLRWVGALREENRKSRLIPFVASSDDAYVLEFSHNHMRVYRNGALVVVPNTQNPYEIFTPWLEQDLPLLKFAQSNDILTVTHEDYSPHEIARYDHNDWRLSLVNFQPGLAPPATPTMVENVVGFTGPETVNQAIFYALTAVNAAGEESLISGALQLVNDLRYWPRNRIVIGWTAHNTATRYNVYKQDNGLWGLIGSTTELTFEDKNLKPNVSDGPPLGRNPFSGAGNNPRTVAFHQQRRFFASTISKPQSIFATNSGNYYNMSVAIPAKESDALEFAIASQKIQKIQHMVPLGELLVFTKSGEWKITGARDEVLSPSSLMAKPQSNYGSADHLAPIVIGSQIVFVQDKGDRVRDIGYDYSKDGYVGNDLTILAEHLFRRNAVVAWAYQQAPFSAIWCVMRDGTLRALTYMREHEVWGWTRHDTINGRVEDVCVVPEGEEDIPYFIVRRYINGTWRRYIERLGFHRFDTRSDCFYVDSGLSYNPAIRAVDIVGQNPSLVITMPPGHGYVIGDELEAETYTASATGERLDGDLRVSAVSGNFVGVQARDAQGNWANIPRLGSVWTGSEVIVRRKAQVLSGLGHLNGQKVVGLADGGVVGDDPNAPLVVTNGSITIPYKAARIHIGLPMTAEFESLELTAGEELTAGRMKSVLLARLRVERTAGIKMGPTFDLLQEHRPREFEDYDEMASLITGDIEVSPPPSTTYRGQVCVRQDLPLPVTMLGLIPDIDYGK